MSNSEKEPMNQSIRRTPKSRLEGKKNAIALWTAIVGLFGAQGIPKIVELLENKPSVEQVQSMIVEQTAKLSEAQHTEVEVIRDLDHRLSALLAAYAEQRAVVGQLKGVVGLLRDVTRDCCTRRHARARLDKAVLSLQTDFTEETHKKSPEVSVGTGANVGAPTNVDTQPSQIKRLKKVPVFRVQQEQAQYPSFEAAPPRLTPGKGLK